MWQDVYPPAIYVRILEICAVKWWDHGLFCTNVCCPTILAALNLFGPKQHHCMSLQYLKYQSRKKSAISQNWKSLKNNSIRIIFSKKCVKIAQTLEYKAILKPWEKKSE